MSLVQRLLGSVALLLLVVGCDGSSSHFFRTIYTSVSEPSQGLPQFTAVGYLDEQPRAYFKSGMKELLPQVSFMKKLKEENAEFWDIYTQRLQHDEKGRATDVKILQNRFNHTKGCHTWQMMVGCELSPEGRKGEYWQYAYDGRDFLSFDEETLTWTAVDMEAQIFKRRWEANPTIVQYTKAFVENACIEWLQKYLEYGKEFLQRKESPVVTVTRKVDFDGLEMLTCHAHGFYPKEIDVVWMKDGQVWDAETFRGVLAPNSDGTYYAWIMVKIDPKDRDHYLCHVEHDSLPEPLEMAWTEPASNMGLLTGCLVGATLLMVIGIIGTLIYNRKKSLTYKAVTGIFPPRYKPDERNVENQMGAMPGTQPVGHIKPSLPAQPPEKT